VAETGDVLAMVLPIEGGRACDDVCVRQYWGVAVGRKILARLKQQNAALRIGAQSGRKNRTGRAGAYNYDVEGLFLHDPSFTLEHVSGAVRTGVPNWP